LTFAESFLKLFAGHSIHLAQLFLQRNAAFLELQQLLALQSPFGLHLAVSGDKTA
jgi:hypothetical protein